MHTVWIVLFWLGVAVAIFIFVQMKKAGQCTGSECDSCDRCTIGSLALFLIGVVALWGGGLGAAGWLVLSAIRR